MADLEHNFTVSHLRRFGELDQATIEAVFEDFAARGRADLARDGVADEDMELSRLMDVRYVGQSYQLPIPVTSGRFDAAEETALRERFHAEHRRAYGYSTPDEPVELVNVHLRATGKTPKPEPRRIAPHQGDLGSAQRAQRSVCFPETGFVDCSVYDRYRLGADAVVRGPAIVDEFDSTIVMLHGDRGRRG
jgi:N-methylhydantoinase A